MTKIISVSVMLKGKRLEALNHIIREVPFRVTHKSFMRLCVVSVLELVETGEMNTFMKEMIKLGKGEIE